jgi:hypothetical protein
MESVSVECFPKVYGGHGENITDYKDLVLFFSEFQKARFLENHTDTFLYATCMRL